MEFLLRLDTLGIVELRYLRGRERFRDWPVFLLIAASRQARVLAYLTREVVEQLHQQILVVEEAAGLGIENDDDEEEEDIDGDEIEVAENAKQTDPESASFSPAFAQALEKLNDLARQRLPENAPSSSASEDLSISADSSLGDEEDALEQLQDAFIQMMEVVRELAEELSTDALKLTGRMRCTRTDIFFTRAEADVDEDEVIVDEEKGDEEVELALILRLFEDGRSKPDDLPAVELQLDVDDFVRLHETIDIALERERRSNRRRRPLA